VCKFSTSQNIKITPSWLENRYRLSDKFQGSSSEVIFCRIRTYTRSFRTYTRSFISVPCLIICIRSCSNTVPIMIHGLEVSLLQNAYLWNFLVGSAMPAGPRYKPLRDQFVKGSECTQSGMTVAVAFERPLFLQCMVRIGLHRRICVEV
jgi:hypothetical protein